MLLKIFLDTNIIIDFISGKKREVFEKIKNEELCVSIFNVLELQYELNERKRNVLLDFLKSFQVYYPSVVTYAKAQEAIILLRKRGFTPHVIDVLISEVVLENNGTFYTSDCDFEHFSNMRVMVYSK